MSFTPCARSRVDGGSARAASRWSVSVMPSFPRAVSAGIGAYMQRIFRKATQLGLPARAALAIARGAGAQGSRVDDSTTDIGRSALRKGSWRLLPPIGVRLG